MRAVARGAISTLQAGLVRSLLSSDRRGRARVVWAGGTCEHQHSKYFSDVIRYFSPENLCLWVIVKYVLPVFTRPCTVCCCCVGVGLASASHGSSHPSVSLHWGAAVRTPGHLQQQGEEGLGRVLGVVRMVWVGDRGSGWGLGNSSKHLSAASEAARDNLEVVLVREAGTSAAYFMQSWVRDTGGITRPGAWLK